MPAPTDSDLPTRIDQSPSLARLDESDSHELPISLSGLDIDAQIEAIVFAAAGPMKASEIRELLQHFDLGISLPRVEQGLRTLIAHYAAREGGFSLVHLDGEGYQFQTVKTAGPLMERMFQTRPRPLSRAALETLAIIAYRQPTTRAEIERIRGVDTGSIIKGLLERQIIRCCGRKEEVGRPMLFATDTEFLRVFGIQALTDLPPLSAFQPVPEAMRQALAQLDESPDTPALTAAELAIPGEVLDRPDVPVLSFSEAIDS